MTQPLVIVALFLVISTVLISVEGNARHHQRHHGAPHRHAQNHCGPQWVMQQETPTRWRLFPNKRIHQQHHVATEGHGGSKETICQRCPIWTLWNPLHKGYGVITHAAVMYFFVFADKVEELICPESTVEGAECFLDTLSRPPLCRREFTEGIMMQWTSMHCVLIMLL